MSCVGYVVFRPPSPSPSPTDTLKDNYSLSHWLFVDRLVSYISSVVPSSGRRRWRLIICDADASSLLAIRVWAGPWLGEGMKTTSIPVVC